MEIEDYWKMKKGSILKDKYGNLMIMTSYYYQGDEMMISWVSFDSGNCSGILPLKGSNIKEDCSCILLGYPVDECEDCLGSGTTESYRYGAQDCTILASNAYDYLKSLLYKSSLLLYEEKHI